jgi:hypothetical protein
MPHTRFEHSQGFNRWQTSRHGSFQAQLVVTRKIARRRSAHTAGMKSLFLKLLRRIVHAAAPCDGDRWVETREPRRWLYWR